MASPIGHVLAGQLCYRGGSALTRAEGRGLMVLCLFAAAAPDLDFLPGVLVGHPALYHQGASHSLSAAVLFTLILAAAYAGFRARRAGSRPGFAAIWIPLLIAYVSHLALDLFGPDKRPPYGIPLFWPFTSATYLAPFQIFLGFHHAAKTGATVNQWISGILVGRNVLALAVEVAILAPPVLVVELWIRHRKARSAARAA